MRLRSSAGSFFTGRHSCLERTAHSLRDLTDLSDEVIQPRIEAIPGVGGVNVNGGRRRQIRVELNPDAMLRAMIASFDGDVSELVGVIRGLIR